MTAKFKPLRTAMADALMQCKKCGAVVSIDMVDILAENLTMIHKDPTEPRFAEDSCGGKMKLYQEVRY